MTSRYDQQDKTKKRMSAILEKAQIESTEQQLKMIQLAELMEDLDINRFEYITEDGREVVSYAKHTFQLQDDLRTLKVFREKKE
jgi:sulfur carrier protein ThiS